MKFKKGACILVPKAFTFSRTVAGQIPTGWHASRYGIPEEIVAQVDRATLWALVYTAEALNMSGITDLYELYKYMHPSEVGTCLGSGMGGSESLAKMFKDRREKKELQNDSPRDVSPGVRVILAAAHVINSFINTTAGWINLLLLSLQAVPSRFPSVHGRPHNPLLNSLLTFRPALLLYSRWNLPVIPCCPEKRKS